MSAEPVPFVPPFRPRRGCRSPRCPEGWRWVRYGCYRRQLSPKVIQRFRCGHCRRTFSTQTFSTTYWLRRPDLLPAVFQRLLACSGYRQIAREARCHPTKVLGLAARLGRHALLSPDRPSTPGRRGEPLVTGGLQLFEFTP